MLGYITWAFIAMVGYSFVFIFAKLAMDGGRISPYTVMSVSVAIVAVASLAVTLLTGEWRLDSYRGQAALMTYLTGVALTLAVVGYFTALSKGPASVVVPIYGLFIAGGAIPGILILGEAVTAKKLLGIGFACVSVILIAT
ncbi:EamA family transporter [Halosegnis sp.]|uniref:EamA family transporter n=1 Tax=Halosegnis sp. TaxID=2864959 RepID=UPI0035D4D59F